MCRSRQIFGLRKIFARISPNFPEKFLYGQVSVPFLWSHTEKIKFRRISSVSFIDHTNRTRCRNISARIFRDFARVFDKSKLLGVRVHPAHNQLIHHCLKIYITDFAKRLHQNLLPEILKNTKVSRTWRVFGKKLFQLQPWADACNILKCSVRNFWRWWKVC